MPASSHQDCSLLKIVSHRRLAASRLVWRPSRSPPACCGHDRCAFVDSSYPFIRCTDCDGFQAALLSVTSFSRHFSMVNSLRGCGLTLSCSRISGNIQQAAELAGDVCLCADTPQAVLVEHRPPLDGPSGHRGCNYQRLSGTPFGNGASRSLRSFR